MDKLAAKREKLIEKQIRIERKLVKIDELVERKEEVQRELDKLAKKKKEVQCELDELAKKKEAIQCRINKYQKKDYIFKYHLIDRKIGVINHVIANPNDEIIRKAYKARKTVTKCKSPQANSCRHKWKWLRSGPSLGFGDFEYTEYKCEKCNEIKKET